METEIAVLATLILALTQIIVRLFPSINKMNTTIGVTIVVGILSFVVSDSVQVITIILALLTEVFGYDLITKSVIPGVKKLMNVNN